MASHSLRTAALAALAVLVAGGCAGSDDTDDTAGSRDASDTAAEERSAERDGGPAEADPATEEAEPLPDTSGPGSGEEEDSDRENTAQEGGGAPPAAADDPAWCSPDALSASLTPLSPGAGNRYAALVLTNTSDTACRTQGWPGLQLTAQDGDDIPTTTVRDDSAAPQVLTVEPGGSAWAQLHWSAVPGEQDPADGNCGPDPAGLAVIPPDEYSPTSAEWDFGSVCGAGRIEALPLAAGTGPPR
ncbi:DUF4232 domain-containing protein [Streptomyces sp. MP131-18]|uniref:DUF4232 domain-containing protein n=1 Tax=Streptomyces sp. MP131-18 TaxID=1857892 RepID=UPI00097CA8C5|nr:DUF4232 domain-containing protein [Streptomyces sp. MP131-18]ONK15893.1 hypothetical protein STBA_67360 [Streptomyces sp. MP131-18]